MKQLKNLLTPFFWVSVPLIACLLACCSCDPHTSIKTPAFDGRVLDARTLRPIQGARVFFTDATNISCVSDSDGHFEMKETRNVHLASIPPEGNWPQRKFYWQVTVSHTNYVAGEINLIGGFKGDVLLEPQK